MTKSLIRKYIWLVNTIHNAGSEGITFNDIASKWFEMDATKYAKRSFHNHINAIYDLFGIEINCIKGRNLNRYYINNKADLKDSSGFQRWLLDALSLNCTLDVKEPLKKRILLEDVPSGRENLTDILKAMDNGKTLTFTYKAFWMDNEESTLYNVEPYALKMFKRRWYLLAKYGDNPLKTYALDRMSNIDEEFNNFTPPEDFDAEAFFDTCFGIICGGDEEPELIYLKVDNYQANYGISASYVRFQTGVALARRNGGGAASRKPAQRDGPHRPSDSGKKLLIVRNAEFFILFSFAHFFDHG